MITKLLIDTKLQLEASPRLSYRAVVTGLTRLQAFSILIECFYELKYRLELEGDRA